MSIKRGSTVIAGVPIIEGALNTASTLPVQNKVIAKAVNDLSDRIDLLAPGGVYTKSEVNNLLNDKADKSTTYTKTEVDNLFATLYPLGSIYIGTQSTCPLVGLIPGSVWTLVSQDRSIQGSSNSHAANTTIAAGLPNIQASWGGTTYGNAAAQICINGAYNAITSVPVSGAATVTNLNTDGADYSCGGSAYHGLGGIKLGFNASSSNSIYGSSTTVQPPAYVVNIWRRTQ